MILQRLSAPNSTFGGSYVCANFGENRSRDAAVRVPIRWIHTDRQTDANRLYNLSHAIIILFIEYAQCAAHRNIDNEHKNT